MACTYQMTAILHEVTSRKHGWGVTLPKQKSMLIHFSIAHIEVKKKTKKTTQVYRRIWMIAYVRMMLCACLYLLEDNQGQCLGGCPCTLQVHPCCEFISWLFMETAAVVSLHSSHSGVVSRQGGLLIAHMANSTIKWAGNCFQKLDTILHLEHDVYPAKKHNVIWRKCHSPLKWDMMECVQKEAYVSTMFAHRCNGKTAAAQSGIRI